MITGKWRKKLILELRVKPHGQIYCCWLLRVAIAFDDRGKAIEPLLNSRLFPSSKFYALLVIQLILLEIDVEINFAQKEKLGLSTTLVWLKY